MDKKIIPVLVFKSFAKEDEVINKFFTDFIKGAGFKPELVESITADKTVAEKVRDTLKKYEVVFGIFVKRFTTSDGIKGTPPDWLIGEIHRSHNEGKIIGVFMEEELTGVKSILNILKGIDPLYFNRNNSPFVDINKIQEYTNSVLKTLIDFKQEVYKNLPYIFKKITKYVIIRKSGLGIASCAFSISPKAERVPEVTHTFCLGDSALKDARFPSFSSMKKNTTFYTRHTQPSFFYKRMSEGINRSCIITEVRNQPIGESPNTYKSFTIKFNPPIDKNEKVFQYGWGFSCPKMFPSTKAQIKLPSKNGVPDFEFMESYIKSLPYSSSI